MKIMLGRSSADPTSSSWDVPDPEASDPEQPAKKRRKTDRHARSSKVGLLLALKKGDTSLFLSVLKGFFVR
jgi:hypothetical protein